MHPNWIRIWKNLQATDQKTRKLIIARDVKFDEILLWFCNFRNKAEPSYTYDDDEEKTAAQVSSEDVKDPTGEKLVLKKTKEVQHMLRWSIRLQAKGDSRKEEEAKKESQEDDLALTDIETHSDSESPKESGEASQGILNSIEGLLSRFSGATEHFWVSLKCGSREDDL